MQAQQTFPTSLTLPGEMPVFPLSGVLLLPRGQLPLNIFEPRYLAMVDRALSNGRMIGMIQPVPPPQGTDSPAGPALYRTGCAGRITSFAEAEGGRYLITLTGVSRFDVIEEMTVLGGFRRVRPDWAPYAADAEPSPGFRLDRERLVVLLKDYFRLQDLTCSWDHIRQSTDEKLVTCLSMICPFEAGEKQALLEAPAGQARADLFMAMLDMAVRSGKHADAPKTGCH